jgi:hypothetical protein
MTNYNKDHRFTLLFSNMCESDAIGIAEMIESMFYTFKVGERWPAVVPETADFSTIRENADGCCFMAYAPSPSHQEVWNQSHLVSVDLAKNRVCFKTIFFGL